MSAPDRPEDAVGTDLLIKIAIDHEWVRLDLAKSARRIWMSADEAIEFAEALIQCAREVGSSRPPAARGVQ